MYRSCSWYVYSSKSSKWHPFGQSFSKNDWLSENPFRCNDFHHYFSCIILVLWIQELFSIILHIIYYSFLNFDENDEVRWRKAIYLSTSTHSAAVLVNQFFHENENNKTIYLKTLFNNRLRKFHTALINWLHIFSLLINC